MGLSKKFFFGQAHKLYWHVDLFFHKLVRT